MFHQPPLTEADIEQITESSTWASLPNALAGKLKESYITSLIRQLYVIEKYLFI